MVTKYLKLITGQYILGDLANEIDGVITLKKPVSIEFNPMAGGLAFVPYDAFYLGKELENIEIKKEHIMHDFSDQIPKEIIDNYIKYKSGIDLVPAQAGSQLNEDQLHELAKASGLILDK
jgi:hypothetical protein